MKTLSTWALIIIVTLFSTNFLGASQKSVAAIVTSISGTFLVKPSGQKDFLAASVGQFLYEGDVGKTLQNSMAAITFVSGVQVKINANTEFTINLKELGKMDEEVTVNEGQVFSKVLRKGSQFGVRTDIALAAVRGTEFDVKVSPPIKTKRKIRVKVKRSEILLKGLENLVRELKFAYERESNERKAKHAAELRAKEESERKEKEEALKELEIRKEALKRAESARKKAEKELSHARKELKKSEKDEKRGEKESEVMTRDQTVSVLSGVVELGNSFGSVNVNAGQVATVSQGEPPQPPREMRPEDKPIWQEQIKTDAARQQEAEQKLQQGTTAAITVQPQEPEEKIIKMEVETPAGKKMLRLKFKKEINKP